MSTYDEKQITFHAVKESGYDFEPFSNYWYEIRLNGIEISRGNTLLDAIETFQESGLLEFDF